jgi:two-component system sensor histidine kinase SenX3
LTLLAEAVQEAADDPEAVDRFAGRMKLEAERLHRLVQQIVELSRLQDDELLDDAGSVPLDELLDRSAEENDVEARARQITVRRDGERGLAVRGSREQLALAVGNLVANAVAYSPDGSRVVVSAAAVGERVEISVADQGIGIPADEVDRIFERFYRLDPARQRSTGGTGLGLSIVKHVAASHGGDVRVWSRPGQGSTFTLSLPGVVLPMATEAVR